MDRWLEAFAYRISVGREVPVKTAQLNPVKNLRAD
jgi:hypothetical protein